MHCTRRIRYSQGRIFSIRDSYETYAHYGTVEDCASSAGMVDSEPYYGEGYDPYSSGGEASLGGDGCSGSGGGGGGDDDGGGGGGDGGGDPTIIDGSGGGSSSSMCDTLPFYYDYVCVEVWVEGVGWETLWCGVAKVCG